MGQLSKFITENEDFSDAYATGKALLDIGIIPGNDLTPEAALTKLSYVLAKDDWDLEKKIKMMQTNIVGMIQHFSMKLDLIVSRKTLNCK